MKKNAWIRAGWGLALLMLVGGAFWAGWPRAETPPPAADVRGGELTSSAAGSAPQRVAAPGAKASAPAAPTAPTPQRGAGLDPLQLAQIEAQWCTHAAQAHAQAVASIEQGVAKPPRDPKALQAWLNDPAVTEERDRRSQAVIALPTFKAGFEVGERLQRQWIERLRQQGDARSLATAAYLEWQWKRSWRPEEVEQAALTRILRGGSDPYAAELWMTAKGHCTPGRPCEHALESRWAVLEPANALAWMPRFSDEQPLSDARWQGLAQARYARSYRHELKRRLLALLGESGGSGLEREKGLELVESVEFDWNAGPSLLALKRSCEALAADSPHRATCAHAADLVWDAPAVNLSDRALARGLAESMGVGGSPRWRQRDEAMNSLGSRMQAARTALSTLLAGSASKGPGCAGHAQRYRLLQEQAGQGEMKHIEDLVQRAEQPAR